MNPPPPRFPAVGCTTARANPTATAASTALPPRRRMSAPTWLASGCTDTTIACSPRPGSAASGHAELIRARRDAAATGPAALVVGPAGAVAAGPGLGAAGAGVVLGGVPRHAAARVSRATSDERILQLCTLTGCAVNA